jgi:hypothetical protein
MARLTSPSEWTVGVGPKSHVSAPTPLTRSSCGHDNHNRTRCRLRHIRTRDIVQFLPVTDASDARPRPGDYGNVGEVKADGSVVGWDRGFTSVTHPSRETLRTLG